MKLVLAIFLAINTVALIGYVLHFIYCLFTPNDHLIKDRVFFADDWFGGYDDTLNMYSILLITINLILLTVYLFIYLANHL